MNVHESSSPAESLHRTLRRIGEASSTNEICETLLEYVGSIQSLSAAVVMLAGPDGQLIPQVQLTRCGGTSTTSTVEPNDDRASAWRREVGEPERAQALLAGRTLQLREASAQASPELLETTLCVVPLIFQGVLRGCLGLRLGQGSHISIGQQDCIELVCLQASMSLEMRRLSTEAKDAAVVQEREREATQRAIDLVEVHQSLGRSVSKLVFHDDIRGFLSVVLLETLRASGAVSVAVFAYDADRDELYNYAQILRGEVVDVKNDPRMEVFATPTRATGNPAWEVIMQQRYFWIDYADPDLRAGPKSTAWHKLHGHRYVVCIPMMNNQRPVGFLGLAFDESEAVRPTEARLERSRVLAQQAALAMQLTRLAEELRESAVAHEREQAQRQRAAELANANSAMRRGVEELSTARNEDEVFGRFLQQAIAASGAVAGAAAKRLHDTEFEFVAVCIGEQLISIADLPDPSMFDRLPEISRRDTSGLFARLLAGKPELMLVDHRLEEWFPEAAIAHRRAGHKAVWQFPFSVGGRVVGILGLAFETEQSPSEVVVQTIQAISNQLSLAVEMLHLSEQAKHGVLLEERNRMAREIHDTLAQSFTGIMMQLRAAQHAAPGNTELVIGCLARAESLAREGLRDARRSVMALRPESAEYGDIVHKIRWLIEQTTAGTAISGDVTVDGLPRTVVPEVGLQLFRIVQEAVANAQRHADPSTLHVVLRFTDTTLTVSITDDGSGFDFVSGLRSGGSGLSGMRQRAKQLGGQLTIDSQRTGGTTVKIEIPAVTS